MRRLTTLSTLLALAMSAGAALAAGNDVSMFGNTPARNMASDETGLPASWDLETGENVLWTQPLGSQSYGGPVVAGGRVFVGTNNEGRRDPAIEGDKGVIMAFDADDGTFLWQAVHDKLPDGRVHDWPWQGICSTPYIEGDRLYYVSNRAEVVCATTREGKPVWSLDMIAELDVFPHNLAAGSPLIVGDLLYTVTGNGVDEGHINIPATLAPSFIAVDKNTGKLVWESDLPGERILHGQWTNPAYGVIQGRPQVIFPGGDGWIYSFDAGEIASKSGKDPLLWKFDLNPKGSVWELGGSGTRNNVISTPVIWDDKVYIGVGQDPEHGEGVGNFWAIDATGSGDVTATHAVWHRGGEDFRRTISTAAIADGLLYISDLSGFLYCLDALTGEHHWTYDTFAAVWGSAFVADGKVYLGDEDGDVVVLKAGKGKDGKPELLAEMNLGAAVYTTPVASNGVLYLTSRNQVFAFAEGAGQKAEAEKPAAK